VSRLPLALAALLLSRGALAAEAPAPRTELPDLTGSWALNRAESEDAREKMREARAKGSGGAGSPGHGPRGEGPSGGAPRGGGPRGGHRGPEGAGPGGEGGSPEDRSGPLRELFEPAETLAITHNGTDVTIDEGEAGTLRLHADGRKTKRENGLVETKAFWNGPELVVESKLDRGARLTSAYLLVPDKRQLLITTRFDPPSGSPVTVRRVYAPSAETRAP
jgi:hypothetical protein